jgi:hypothetical protein
MAQRKQAGTSTKDFFVSYNRADRTWAVWIAWQLEAAGYEVVLQEWDFRPGSNFALEMQQAVQGAARTVAVLSPDFLASAYTQPEWAAAFAGDPTGAQRKLVPVRVRECRPDGLLSQVVYIDLVGLDETMARQKLLGGVKRGRAKPETPPAFPGSVSAPTKKAPRFPGPRSTVASSASRRGSSAPPAAASTRRRAADGPAAPRPQRGGAAVTSAAAPTRPAPKRARPPSPAPKGAAGDDGASLKRAQALVPTERHSGDCLLLVVVAASPPQRLLRPTQLEHPDLATWMKKESLFGRAAVLDSEEGAKARTERDTLVVEQGRASVLVGEHGTVRIVVPPTREKPNGWGGLSGLVLIEDDVRSGIERALRFAAGVLDHVDTSRAVGRVTVVVGLLGVGHRAWRSRQEHERSPNMLSGMSMTGRDSVAVHPDPPGMERQALRRAAKGLAADLTVLLRREMQ